MQSIFWPTLGIGERYDLKGCLMGRFEDPSVRDKTEEFVLKDQNFQDIKIHLGRERAW